MQKVNLQAEDSYVRSDNIMEKGLAVKLTLVVKFRRKSSCHCVKITSKVQKVRAGRCVAVIQTREALSPDLQQLLVIKEVPAEQQAWSKV